MSRHLTADEVLRLVEGCEAGSPLEAHVDRCDGCARRVRSEAQLELILRAHFREARCGTSPMPGVQVAAETPAPGPRASGWGVLAATALLAALVAWFPALPDGLKHGSDAPCAGVTVDGGALPVTFAAAREERTEVHGTP